MEHHQHLLTVGIPPLEIGRRFPAIDLLAAKGYINSFITFNPDAREYLSKGPVKVTQGEDL